MTRTARSRPDSVSDDGTGASRTRVLLVGVNYAPEATGIAPYTTALARGLAGRDVDVRVLTAKPHYPEWRVPQQYRGGVLHEVDGAVALTRLPHYVPADPTGVRRLLSELSFGLHLLVARWGSPDVVVFVSPALFATGLGMLRAVLTPRLRSVVWVQDLYGLGLVEAAGHRAGGVVPRVVGAVERAVLRAADAVVVIHDRFAESVAALGARRDRLAVIRNWSHIEAVPDGRSRGDRRGLGWSDDEVVALHTGNIGVKQDLGNLLEAARIADEQGRAVRFVVMGDGSQRAELQERARRLGIRRLEFAAPASREAYLGVLSAADVLLVNEAEGLRDMAVPSKLTSYFAAGRPVIAATDRRSITAAEVSAAGAGVRVEPARPAELLAAVERVAADHAAAARYGASAQDYRRRVLSEDAAVDAFETVIGGVARHRRGGSANRPGRDGGPVRAAPRPSGRSAPAAGR